MKNNKDIIGYDKNDIIINRPHLLAPWQKGFEWSIATVGWILWFFVCRPFIIFSLWFFGFRFFYTHMIILEGLKGLQELWLVYSTIIILIILIVRGWNVYNYRRYKDKDRRKERRPVDSRDISGYFKIALDQVEGIKQNAVVDVEFHENNQITLHTTDEDGKHSAPGYFKSS